MTNTKNKLVTLIFIVISILLGSCGPKYNKPKKIASDDKDDSIHSEQKSSITDSTISTTESEPRIIFLVYQVYAKKTENQNRILLLEKNITKGQLKSKEKRSKHNIPGNFVCIELDEFKNPIERYFLENPVDKQVEYTSPNGTLQRRQVSLDSAETFLRFQLNSKTRFIALSEIGANAKAYLIVNSVE